MIRSVCALSVVTLLGLSLAVSRAQDADNIRIDVEDDRYTVRAENVPLGEVAAALSDTTGVDLEFPEKLSSTAISIDVEGVTFEKLMTTLAGSHALVYELDEEGNYRIASARLTSQELLEAQKLSWGERRALGRMKRQARRVAKEIDELYGYAGVLDFDAAKALVQQRKDRFNALVDELAALGPGGARALQETFSDVESTRGRLAMVKALERIDDENGSLALGALYESEEANHSLRREMVASLGHRKDDPRTQEVLTSILDTEEDRRLLGPTIMALSGQPGAVETLAGVINGTDGDRDLKREAIRSLGEIGGAEALGVLAAAASSSEEKMVRTSAIQEMGRTFGEQAVAVLEPLVGDADDSIAVSAVKALGRIPSASAREALDRIAAGQGSALAQQWAQSLVE